MNQAQLFDDSGKVLRDLGMQQAIDHADTDSPGWSERAYEALKEYLKRHSGEFMGEDVRLWAYQDYKLERADNHRAWGSVINRAARNGLIRKVGIRQVANPVAHCANANVWSRGLA